MLEREEAGLRARMSTLLKEVCEGAHIRAYVRSPKDCMYVCTGLKPLRGSQALIRAAELIREVLIYLVFLR